MLSDLLYIYSATDAVKSQNRAVFPEPFTKNKTLKIKVCTFTLGKSLLSECSPTFSIGAMIVDNIWQHWAILLRKLKITRKKEHYEKAKF